MEFVAQVGKEVLIGEPIHHGLYVLDRVCE